MTSSVTLAAADRPHFNVGPLIPIAKELLTDPGFFQSFKVTLDCLDSSALGNVSLISLKNLPYVLYDDHTVVKEFENPISARMRYLEAVVLSTASAVYNFVMGLLFTAGTLVTFGQVKMISSQMQKHWTQTVLAVMSVGIASVGSVSPSLGIAMNVASLAGIAAAVYQVTEGSLITQICTVYQNHRVQIQDAVLDALNRDQNAFNAEFAGFFDFLDANLTPSRVTSLQEFMDLAGRIPHVPSVAFELPPDLMSGALADMRQRVGGLAQAQA